MSLSRRNFIKGCTIAGCLLMPGMASSGKDQGIKQSQNGDADADVKRSIKAGFGDGFSLHAHCRSNGLTYADIEHLGTRYKVVSADLVEWKTLAKA